MAKITECLEEIIGVASAVDEEVITSSKWWHEDYWERKAVESKCGEIRKRDLEAS